jgi:pimeloyl-ACP methyl ester carboxylesterase
MNIYILHGWAIDAENEKKWQPLMNALKKTGLSVKFLPIPGLTTPVVEVWTLTDYERWLEEQLEKESKVILLGHSFGGQLAIRYAAHHPKQVEKLILIDASGMRPKSLKAQIKRNVFKGIAKVGHVFTQNETLRKFLYMLAREKDYQQASPVLRQTMANVLADEVVADLPQVKAPTLIIWGAQDRATPLSHGQFYAQHITGSQLKVIEAARHSPQFTHVDQVSQLVAEFTKNKG